MLSFTHYQCLGFVVSTQVVERLPWNGVEVWLKDTWDMLYTTWYMDWGLLVLAVSAAIIMTIVRAILNFVLLNVSSCNDYSCVKLFCSIAKGLFNCSLNRTEEICLSVCLSDALFFGHCKVIC